MQRNQNRREIGNIGEVATAAFLVRNGYKILERNYTIRGGEVDIIAEKNGVVAFVEVKTRGKRALDTGEGAITPGKKSHIIKTAESYLAKSGKDCECRFDVAVAQIQDESVRSLKYYVAAFDASK